MYPAVESQASLPAPMAWLRSHPGGRLAVGLIGPGRVGSALLEPLRSAQARLARDTGLPLSLSAIVAGWRMWLDCDDPEINARHGAQTWRPTELDMFAAHVRGEGGHAMPVDCSASEYVVAHYADWLATGLHIVTPNKLAISGPLPRWQAIRAASSGGGRLRYEATVRVGIPVVQTLRDLLDAGDELLCVEGTLSGTRAMLCGRHDGDQPFSTLLAEAHARGYTEPDPRDDLSGLDVVRKLVILAREAGRPLSLEDFDVENLVPVALRDQPSANFMRDVNELDAPMATYLTAARARGGVLRHVARLDREGHASVRLEVLPIAHPFAQSPLNDNVVQFSTRRCCDNPLRVQGPGTGPEVTAAGVFADLLRTAETLEAAA